MTEHARKMTFAISHALVWALVCGVGWASLAPRAAAESLGGETVAIENARIVTVSGPTIERGTVLIRAGKIAAVGASVEVPATARRVDATGLVVYPGMLDSWTVLGLLEVGQTAATNDTAELGEYNPHLRAYEAFNANSELIAPARIAGITTVVSAPSGGVLSGQPLLVDLAGETVDDMQVRKSLGVAFNFPTAVPSASFDPATQQVRRTSDTEAKRNRDKKLDEIRALLGDAQAYAVAVDARARDQGLPPLERNLRLEALRPVVRGEAPVIVAAGPERDIRAAVEFAGELKLKMILRTGSSDVMKVASLLAEKRIPVVLGPMFALPGREDDRYDLPQQVPQALRAAGVAFAFSTNDSAQIRDLPYNAAMAVAYGGLSRDDAVRAITLWPARIWGVEDRVGSVEVGKYANLVVTTGDLLEVRSEVRFVFVEGKQIPLVSRQTQFYERYRKSR